MEETIPYQNLYIYEISGEISDSKTFFQEDFIGCWNEGEMSCLFFSAPHERDVEAFVKKKGFSLLSTHVMDYKAWQAGEELKPFKVGNLVICPPWEECATGEGETLILLDPCVVFGTGYHPTTRSCLKALWDLYQKERPGTVLDLGTGTGILALAAVKLGARKVLAVDCNELAAETASRNVMLNGESNRIEVKKGKAEDFIKEEADLVCANLHYQVIEGLIHQESFFAKRWILLSGLFVKDAEEIERQLNRRGIETLQKYQEKNWLTWLGVNGILIDL
jgi:ribosomal protein L11 methyltransferase